VSRTERDDWWKEEGRKKYKEIMKQNMLNCSVFYDENMA
jgi:hypothetical protein